jgi:hypothetical protein
LGTKDFLEVGKLALADSEPRNSETQFMSTAVWMLRKQFPNLKLAFSWADGIWGKPGYVYQAASFLYGGFIWTDVYMDREGARVHPLQLQSKMKTYLRTQRPNAVELAERGWRHIRGKQFRYVRFLCDRAEQKRLLAESPFYWNTDHPKGDSLEWREKTVAGWVPCPQPKFAGAWGRPKKLAA